MYQLLIVDDEIHAVRGVISCVEWDKFNISGVYSAYNIRQAKEVFNKHAVNIMVCDIEMPQGNGLELLSWVREYYPSTVCILLTCHAEFEYAKQAVQLGVLDYMLKPVRPAELESVIRKAISKIEKERELIASNETYRHYYQLWATHKPLFIERFWLELLDRTIPLNPDAIAIKLEKFDIPYSSDMQFIPVLICIQRWHNKLMPLEEKNMESGLKNAVEELLIKGDKLGRVIPLKRGVLLAVLPVNNTVINDMERLRKDSQSFLNSCSRNCQYDLSCYIGIPSFIHEVPDMLDALVKMDTDNVIWSNRAFFINEQVTIEEPIKLPIMYGWPEMLIQGERERLLAEIEGSLDDLSRAEGLNTEVLHEFYQDFMQIVYYVLQQRGLQAHQIFSRDELKEKEDVITRSVIELREWAKYAVNKVIDSIMSAVQAQSLVEKIKLYIAQHMNNDLTREDIAKHFYISPDYLTRIFKKETGLYISDYLTQERIKIAKDLLVNTNMLVSEIVSFIGYSNFSHFSKIFKKATNLKPLDYRKKKQMQ